jgi:hypothetical protein
MPINISNFVSHAHREGLPLQMILFVWNNYRTKIGKSNDTSPRCSGRWWRFHTNTVYLRKGTVGDLQQASLGVHWVRRERDGKSMPMWWSDLAAVQSLYHEATHAYVHNWCRDELDLFHYQLDKAKAHYKGAKVRHAAVTKVVDDPWTLGLEAACEYVGHRASFFWETLDSLHFILQHDLKLGPPDLNGIRSRAEQIRSRYDKAMSERVFGYEKRENDSEYHTVDRPMPPFLTRMCDDLLEYKIPNAFMAAPRLAHLYRDILRQANDGLDR